MANAATGADETRGTQEPLGTLLVRRGLITDEQLSDALAAQKTSGVPLGKIVVERGYVRPEAVAQALATQHGGLLKTEYGFATGFGAASAAPGTVVAPPVSGPDALRGELAHASEEAERLREDNARLVQLRSELEQRLAAESRRVAALEHELAQSPAAPSHDETDEVTALQAALAERNATIERFAANAESWKTALAERDDMIRSLVDGRDEAAAELDARAEAITRLEEAVETAAAQADDTTEPDRLRSELSARDEAVADAERARDKALKQVADGESGRAEALAQLRAVKGHLAEQDASRAGLVAERDAALVELETLTVALDGRDAAIAELVAKLETATAPQPARWAGADRHLLYFRGPETYELVERAGPPPAAGDVVDVPCGAKTVARVAAAPMPGTPLACAYLLG
jgi:DNA repair exonuclease SbcCD ATPase subunit